MLIFWLLLPWVTNTYCRNYSILIIFVLLRLRGFIIIIIGWRSNSVFSLMGAIRFIAQSIFYEVSFMLILFRVMILSYFFFFYLKIWQLYMWNIVILMPIFFRWPLKTPDEILRVSRRTRSSLSLSLSRARARAHQWRLKKLAIESDTRSDDGSNDRSIRGSASFRFRIIVSSHSSFVFVWNIRRSCPSIGASVRNE
jgi:hypothetical protein